MLSSAINAQVRVQYPRYLWEYKFLNSDAFVLILCVLGFSMAGWLLCCHSTIDPKFSNLNKKLPFSQS